MSYLDLYGPRALYVIVANAHYSDYDTVAYVSHRRESLEAARDLMADDYDHEGHYVARIVRADNSERYVEAWEKRQRARWDVMFNPKGV